LKTDITLLFFSRDLPSFYAILLFFIYDLLFFISGLLFFLKSAFSDSELFQCFVFPLA